jgi:hypothetical protein
MPRIPKAVTKQTKHIVAGVATLIWSVFLVPLSEAIFFDALTPGSKEHILSLFLKIGFAATLYGVVYFIAHFVSKLLQRSAFHWQWLKFFAIYFGINLLLFIVIFPGHFVSDEFNILNDAQTYNLQTWQHIITYLYYVYSLYLFPSAPILVLVQFTIISLIVGFVLAKLRDLLPRRKNLVYLLFIPLLLPPILLNNFYPLRTPLYGFLELLVVFNFIVLLLGKATLRPFAWVLGFSSLIAIIGFWRSEGIYLLLLLPVVIYKSGLITKNNFRRLQPWAFALLALLPVAISATLTRATSDPAYSLTATASPLSLFLNNETIVKENAEEFETVGKVLNLETLRETADYTEIRSFWGLSQYEPVLQPHYEEHLGDYYKAVAVIFAEHPIEFLKAKMKTFLHANALDASKPHVTLSGVYLNKDIGDDFEDGRIDHFFAQNRWAHPLDAEARQTTIQSLLMITEKYEPTLARQVVWSAIPVGILLVLAGAYLAWRRHWVWVIGVIIILIQAGITFLTAPASYFMYYVPVYIAGWFLLGIIAVYFLARRLKT